MSINIPIIEPINTNIKDSVGRLKNTLYNKVMGNVVSIDAFRSKFLGSNARSYLFICNIQFPGKSKDIGLPQIILNELSNLYMPENVIADDDYKYFVRATTLPESIIEETSTFFCGQEYKLASVRRVQDWTVTFLVNNNASILERFWKWHLMIHNPETNVYGKPDEYMRNQKIQMLGTDGFPICTYEIINAWPKTIGQIDLNYENNQFATFDVTFSYQYHKVKREPLSDTDKIRKDIQSIGVSIRNYL